MLYIKASALLVTIVVVISVGSIAGTTPYCWDIFNMVSVGRDHSLGLLSNGTLLSWGRNDYGQLGLGMQHFQVLTPNIVYPLKFGRKWIHIVGGFSNSFAIQDDGTLWGFGFNMYGNLGDGTRTPRYYPVQIGKDTDWKLVTVSPISNHALGMKNDGSLYAWGLNNHGQLGNNSTKDSNFPIAVLPGQKWKYMFTGSAFSFGIQVDGTLWGWGYNSYGEVGDGTQVDKWIPTQVGKNITWKLGSGGLYDVLALDENGNLYAWGPNHNGEHGDFTVNTTKLVPTRVTSNNITWTLITSGESFSMGIASNGTLFGWGSNALGEIGDGTKQNMRLAPVKVAAEHHAPWKIVAPGTHHTLAVSEKGVLIAWASNSNGQLGVGTQIDSILPELCNGYDVCHPTSQCIAKCPEGFGNISFFCLQCGPGCAECPDSASTCTKCFPGKVLFQNTCTCDANCLTCEGTIEHCTSCKEKLYIDPKSYTCEPNCSSNCLTCSGFTNNCTSCRFGDFLKEASCHHCDENCATCSGNSKNCQSCKSDLYLDEKNHNCTKDCDSNCVECWNTTTYCTACKIAEFVSSSNTCENCSTDCVTCEIKANHCTSCRADQLLFMGSCENCSVNCSTCAVRPDFCTSCSTNLYLDLGNHTCVSTCDSNCLSCATSTTNCTSCSDGKFLTNAATCNTCDPACLKCSGNATFCTACPSGLDLDDKTHQCLRHNGCQGFLCPVPIILGCVSIISIIAALLLYDAKNKKKRGNESLLSEGIINT